MASNSFFCIDAYTSGNPVRLIAGGAPVLQGDSVMEKRLHFLREYDWLRKSSLFKPEGNQITTGCVFYPASNANNDAAILFIESTGCKLMSGHGTIGAVTIAIQEGIIASKVPGKLRLETPAGLVIAEYAMSGSRVKSVKITNVPSFLFAEQLEVDCPGLGNIKVDVAFGGNFFAIVDPQTNYPGLQDFTASQLVKWSGVFCKQLNEMYRFVHPEDKSISGLSHILWTGRSISSTANGRTATFYGDNAIDRTNCGTSASARMAQWYARGKLRKGDRFINETMIGSRHTGIIEDTTTVNGGSAIVPSMEGWALVYGYNHINVDKTFQV